MQALNILDISEDNPVEISVSQNYQSEMDTAAYVASPILADDSALMTIRQQDGEEVQQDDDVIRGDQEEQDATEKIIDTGTKFAIEQHDASPTLPAQAVNPVSEGELELSLVT